MMCCYYPTTTFAIDDDADFLKTLTKYLGIPNCIPHLSPTKAINALCDQNALQRIQTRVLNTVAAPEAFNSFPEDYAVMVNSRRIHEEIYNADRFKDVSVVIVDYYMDGITGIEVCQSLSKHPAKKILLTGGADMENIALEAFNNGIIHQYISKSDPELPNKLKQCVSVLKETYFRDLTSALSPHLSANSLNLFQYTAYINFISSLREQLNTVEYYTIDTTGSCIFLDDQGETTWCIIKHDSEIEDFIKLAQDEECSIDITQALSDRNMIPFFFSNKDFQQPIAEWPKYLHKAQPLPGINGYYYAVIKGHCNHLNKIEAYASHRNKLATLKPDTGNSHA